MKQKFILTAALVSALAFTACVDETESASVTKVREAKAEQLLAQAGLLKAQAEAARITAEAEKAYKEAQAAAEKAAAERDAAQKAIDEAQARILNAQADALEIENKLAEAKAAIDAENYSKEQQAKYEQLLEALRKQQLENEKLQAQLTDELEKLELTKLQYTQQIQQIIDQMAQAEIAQEIAILDLQKQLMQAQADLENKAQDLADAARQRLLAAAGLYRNAVSRLMSAQQTVLQKQQALDQIKLGVLNAQEAAEKTIADALEKIDIDNAKLAIYEEYLGDLDLKELDNKYLVLKLEATEKWDAYKAALDTLQLKNLAKQDASTTLSEAIQLYNAHYYHDMNYTTDANGLFINPFDEETWNWSWTNPFSQFTSDNDITYAWARYEYMQKLNADTDQAIQDSIVALEASDAYNYIFNHNVKVDGNNYFASIFKFPFNNAGSSNSNLYTEENGVKTWALPELNTITAEEVELARLKYEEEIENNTEAGVTYTQYLKWTNRLLYGQGGKPTQQMWNRLAWYGYSPNIYMWSSYDEDADDSELVTCVKDSIPLALASIENSKQIVQDYKDDVKALNDELVDAMIEAGLIEIDEDNYNGDPIDFNNFITYGSLPFGVSRSSSDFWSFYVASSNISNILSDEELDDLFQEIVELEKDTAQAKKDTAALNAALKVAQAAVAPTGDLQKAYDKANSIYNDAITAGASQSTIAKLYVEREETQRKINDANSNVTAIQTKLTDAKNKLDPTYPGNLIDQIDTKVNTYKTSELASYNAKKAIADKLGETMDAVEYKALVEELNELTSLSSTMSSLVSSAETEHQNAVDAYKGLLVMTNKNENGVNGSPYSGSKSLPVLIEENSTYKNRLDAEYALFQNWDKLVEELEGLLAAINNAEVTEEDLAVAKAAMESAEAKFVAATEALAEAQEAYAEAEQAYNDAYDAKVVALRAYEAVNTEKAILDHIWYNSGWESTYDPDGVPTQYPDHYYTALKNEIVTLQNDIKTQEGLIESSSKVDTKEDAIALAELALKAAMVDVEILAAEVEVYKAALEALDKDGTFTDAIGDAATPNETEGPDSGFAGEGDDSGFNQDPEETADPNETEGPDSDFGGEGDDSGFGI